MSTDNNILVSIWVTTYNHEKYIAKALDSVLMQKVNFDYQIVVGEDKSTDNTRKILLEYQNKYPDKIKLLLHDKNLGQMKNSIVTWQECTGKYVALLDGDDYWQDPSKLQKQVDFLETHSAYAMSHHDSVLVDENGNIASTTFHYRQDYTQDELLCGIATMPTSATMLRNIDIDFPDYMLKAYAPDTVLGHYAGFKGGAKFQDNIENSAYRVHINGIWSLVSQIKKVVASVDVRRRLKKNLEDDTRLMNMIEDSIEKSYLEYLFSLLRALEIKQYIKLIGIILQDTQTKSIKVILMHLLDVPKRIFAKLLKLFLGKH